MSEHQNLSAQRKLLPAAVLATTLLLAACNSEPEDDQQFPPYPTTEATANSTTETEVNPEIALNRAEIATSDKSAKIAKDILKDASVPRKFTGSQLEFTSSTETSSGTFVSDIGVNEYVLPTHNDDTSRKVRLTYSPSKRVLSVADSVETKEGSDVERSDVILKFRIDPDSLMEFEPAITRTGYEALRSMQSEMGTMLVRAEIRSDNREPVTLQAVLGEGYLEDGSPAYYSEDEEPDFYDHHFKIQNGASDKPHTASIEELAAFDAALSQTYAAMQQSILPPPSH